MKTTTQIGMPTIQIRRDPFARETLLRTVVVHVTSGCANCGYGGRPTKRGPRLFLYSIETDAGQEFKDNHYFCSLSCRNNYYGK